MLKTIDVEGKNKCSSCGGCRIICPNDAIVFTISNSGFFQPVIDYNKCNNCGLCMQVCYKYYEIDLDNSIDISKCTYYAAWSKDNEIRFNSSSGGIIQEMLTWGLKNGYNVIGCSYNDLSNSAEHIIIDNVEKLSKIQGSKYLQSNFSKFKDEIDFNQNYIVVGTPCQIHAMVKIAEAKKKRENFIFIDFFCHGTPSYNLWKAYKKYVKVRGINKIEKIDFRYKNKSWNDFSMFIKDDLHTYNADKMEDPFLRLFLSNACLNEPCFSCKFRFNKLSSDIRVGDFWGKEYKDNKEGVNLVIAASKTGNKIMKEVSEKIYTKQKGFPSIIESQFCGDRLYEPKFNDELKKMIENDVSLEKIMNRYFDDSFIGKVKRKIAKVTYKTNKSLLNENQ